VVKKIKFDGKEYDLSELTEGARAQFASLQFVEEKLKELNNMQALLQRAKNSYVDGLKKEMISNKAGFLLEGD